MNHIFLILCYVMLLIKRSFARDWCPNNAFESVWNCLLEEPNHHGKEWSQILNQRIECSKVGDCTMKPWQWFDDKLRLVRNYAKCMKKIAIAKESWNESEMRRLAMVAYRKCRKELADHFPELNVNPNQ